MSTWSHHARHTRAHASGGVGRRPPPPRKRTPRLSPRTKPRTHRSKESGKMHKFYTAGLKCTQVCLWGGDAVVCGGSPSRRQAAATSAARVQGASHRRWTHPQAHHKHAQCCHCCRREQKGWYTCRVPTHIPAAPASCCCCCCCCCCCEHNAPKKHPIHTAADSTNGCCQEPRSIACNQRLLLLLPHSSRRSRSAAAACATHKQALELRARAFTPPHHPSQPDAALPHTPTDSRHATHTHTRTPAEGVREGNGADFGSSTTQQM
jgi:hypothetical protein